MRRNNNNHLSLYGGGDDSDDDFYGGNMPAELAAYGGKKRKRSASKASRASRKRSRSRSSSRKRSAKEKKTYTLVSADGKELGGEYVGTSPSAAAKKAAKSKLPKKGTGTATVYIRQVTLGKGHNKVFCYHASQKMVEAPAHFKKLGITSGKVREVRVKALDCPKNLLD